MTQNESQIEMADLHNLGVKIINMLGDNHVPVEQGIALLISLVVSGMRAAGADEEQMIKTLVRIVTQMTQPIEGTLQ